MLQRDARQMSRDRPSRGAPPGRLTVVCSLVLVLSGAVLPGRDAAAQTPSEKTEAARLFETAIEALDLAGPVEERSRCDLLLALGEARSRAGATSISSSVR